MGWSRRRRKPSPAVHPLSHGSQSPARPGEGQAPPQGQTSQGGEASAPQQQGAEKPPQSGAFSQGIRSAGRFEIIVDSIRRTRSPREFHRTEQELSNRSVCFVRWVCLQAAGVDAGWRSAPELRSTGSGGFVGKRPHTLLFVGPLEGAVCSLPVVLPRAEHRQPCTEQDSPGCAGGPAPGAETGGFPGWHVATRWTWQGSLPCSGPGRSQRAFPRMTLALVLSLWPWQVAG